MNNHELDNLLKSAAPPVVPAELWEEMPRRVTAGIRAQANREMPPASETRPWWTSWAWGFSGAAACLAIVFALGNWPAAESPNGLLQNAKLLREVLTLFPNQVQAIIQDEEGLRLSLADRPDVPASTPLWIQVCDGKHCRAFVTFSGQMVEFAGQRIEVLADAQGKVMLVGDHFFWSSVETAAPDHLRIDARELLHVL